MAQATVSRRFRVCGRLLARTPWPPCRSPCAPLRPSLRTQGTFSDPTRYVLSTSHMVQQLPQHGPQSVPSRVFHCVAPNSVLCGGAAHLLIMVAQLWRYWVCEGLQVDVYPPERRPRVQQGDRLLGLAGVFCGYWRVGPTGRVRFIPQPPAGRPCRPRARTQVVRGP